MTRSVRLGVLAVVVASCVLGLVWVLRGEAPGTDLVARSDVLGTLVTVVGLPIAVVGALVALRRRGNGQVTDEELNAAASYLARESETYWRAQARGRGIYAPIPAAVRWRWASPDIAAPAADIGAEAHSFSAGTVTRIGSELYDRLPTNRARMVIVGPPGSGKTGALLLLMLDVLGRADASLAPVPVWLTMGSWNPRTPLVKWVLAQIARDYPGITSPDWGGSPIVGELFRRGRLALFLDGLDEMPEASRAKAIRQLDAADGVRLVLTSRPDEFRSALGSSRLFGAAVVETLPVEPRAAGDFWLREQLAERRHMWTEVVEYINRHPDSVAARTFTTPLALSLARDAYQSAGDPRELLDQGLHATPDELLSFLLTRFFHLAYPDLAERERAIRWLGWIARRMGRDRDLAWWRISRLRGQWTTPRGVPGQPRRSRVDLTRTQIQSERPDAATRVARWDDRGSPVIRVQVGFVVIALVLTVFAARLIQIQGLEAAETQALYLGEPVPDQTLAASATYVAVAVLFGLLAGRFATWAANEVRDPVKNLPATTPLESYRAEKRFAVRGACLFAVSTALLLPIVGVSVAVAFAAAAATSVAFGPAAALWLLEVVTPLTGSRRVRFMTLLDEASRKQVLRQVGPVYQFRHAALQEFLASVTRR